MNLLLRKIACFTLIWPPIDFLLCDLAQIYNSNSFGNGTSSYEISAKLEVFEYRMKIQDGRRVMDLYELRNLDSPSTDIYINEI